MKAAKLFWILIVIAMISVIAAYATDTVGKAPLDMKVSYENVDLSVALGSEAALIDSFMLTPEEGKKIKLTDPRTNAEELYIVVSGDYRGIYYMYLADDEEITVGLGESAELELNDIAYEISLLDSTYILEVSDGRDDAIKYQDAEGKKLDFTLDEKLKLHKKTGGVEELEIPEDNSLTVKFRAKVSSADILDLEALEAAAGEEAAEQGELLKELAPDTDCYDHDADVESPFELSSYAYDKEGNVLDDFCTPNILHEAYCTDDEQLAIKEIECNCISGACRLEREAMEDVTAFCFDTDQLSSEILGTASITRQKSMFNRKGVSVGFYSTESGRDFGIWKDSCSSDKGLVEYHCGSDGRARFVTVNCACSNGKCVDYPICWDTDGGENANAKGTLTLIKGSDLTIGLDITRERDVEGKKETTTYVDSCSGKNILEYYCDSEIKEGYASKEIACEELCFEGKCVSEEPEEVVECTIDMNCGIKEVCTDGECVAESIDYDNLDSIAAALQRRMNRANALNAIMDDLGIGIYVAEADDNEIVIEDGVELCATDDDCTTGVCGELQEKTLSMGVETTPRTFLSRTIDVEHIIKENKVATIKVSYSDMVGTANIEEGNTENLLWVDVTVNQVDTDRVGLTFSGRQCTSEETEDEAEPMETEESAVIPPVEEGVESAQKEIAEQGIFSRVIGRLFH